MLRLGLPSWKQLYIIKIRSFIFVVSASILALQACTYKKSGVETPVPAQSAQQNDQGIEKSFFLNKVSAKVNGIDTMVYEPKDFICAWAPETEVGMVFNSHNAPITGHCNVQFEISENFLIAKMINPSFVEDSSRWETILTIPITKHYYYEKAKDEYGRETNVYVENSSRSHWSARPMMKINLAGLKILNEWVRFSPNESSIQKIEDVEFDNVNNFLGFTVNVSDSSTVSQSKIRVNFLKFQHNENFKKTPYSDKNSRYMNILHVLGKKVDGIYQTLYAAHWDLSRAHEMYLLNFPERYRELGESVIEDWNQAFRNIGIVKPEQKAFTVGSLKEMKHPFDLRYSSIVWVEDKKIAESSPLGIGMAIADVRNGEILWSGITIYGGALEKYIKSYTPNPSLASQSEGKVASMMAQKMEKLRFENINLNDSIESFRKKFNVSPKFSFSQASVGNFSELMPKSRMSGLSRTASTDKGEKQQPTLNAEMGATAQQNDLRGNIACMSRTFSDVAEGWSHAISLQKENRSYDSIIQSVVKELISHEYGHVMGLGHQFKENILPPDGTVPEQIPAWGYSLKDQKNRATEKNNFTQFSSVMGYRSPIAEISSRVEDIKPGPQDHLVLAYLYRQQFATFKRGASQFTFENVPTSGVIPEESLINKEYKTSYFPQCNDWQASLSVDPYCNRFDRGSSATDIVKNYLSDFNDRLLQSLFSFTSARNSAPWSAEDRLWQSSFRTFGRVRVFYDYMRTKYRDIFHKFKGDEDSLLEFAQSCRSQDSANTTWLEIFSKNPELRDLCRANLLALENITDKLKLSATDHTKLNIDDAYVPTGISGGDADRDWGKAMGSWSEMSVFPIKVASMYALTSPAPWVDENIDLSIPYYSQPDQKFSFGSLYPREYTNAISSAMKDNLHFASLGKEERTSLGSTAKILGYFNYLSRLNNDGNYFSDRLIQHLRSQTEFSFSVSLIVLEAEQSEKLKGTTRYSRFSGKVYGLNSDQTQPTTEVYILPDGRVVARAENMFLYPITRLEFFDSNKAYVVAYKLDYYREATNPLSEIGIKAKLREIHNSVIDSCLRGHDGNQNGLSYYFNNTNDEFEGFDIKDGIATDTTGEKQMKFLSSVNEQFKKYNRNKSLKVRPEVCEEALRGLGLIVSSAALLNGYYLPELMDFIQK